MFAYGKAISCQQSAVSCALRARAIGVRRKAKDGKVSFQLKQGERSQKPPGGGR